MLQMTKLPMIYIDSISVSVNILGPADRYLYIFTYTMDAFFEDPISGWGMTSLNVLAEFNIPYFKDPFCTCIKAYKNV